MQSHKKDQQSEGLLVFYLSAYSLRISETYSHTYGINAVSYTHLDVYKRQGSHLCIRIFGAHPRQGRNAHKVFIPADIICTFSAHVPITPTCARRIKQILFRAENTVSRISESRYNVAVLVQMIVERADVDIHIRMCLLHLFHTFRCCDNAHQADIFYAFIL